MELNAEYTVQVKAPHFRAGLVLDRFDYVIASAPILRYMRGWYMSQVLDFLAVKEWEILPCDNGRN